MILSINSPTPKLAHTINTPNRISTKEGIVNLVFFGNNRCNGGQYKRAKTNIKIPNAASLPTKQLINPIAEKSIVKSQFKKAVIPCFILFNFFNFFCRNSCNNGVIKNSFSNHCTSSYNSILSNGYTRQNNGASTNPSIFFNHNFC